MIKIYFLLRDCKKLIAKYGPKHADVESPEFMMDVLKLLDKYRGMEKSNDIIIDTMALIERAHRMENAPSGATNTEQGNVTR